jgi:hypothetical protein
MKVNVVEIGRQGVECIKLLAQYRVQRQNSEPSGFIKSGDFVIR